MTYAGSSKVMAQTSLPEWVPEGAIHYLAHTELGQPIRALARVAGVHASTIMRQIRKIETRRDDPLVDGALRRLGDAHRLLQADPAVKKAQSANPADALPDEHTLNREGLRIEPRRLADFAPLV